MAEYMFNVYPDYDLADKKRMYFDYVKYFLSRTLNIFQYEGLPETIPQRELEYQLQLYGHVGVFEKNGSLYALKGSMASKPNPYYLPTGYTIANPALHIGECFNTQWSETPNCIVCGNDSLYIGLLPLVGKTSKQLVENDISLLMANINSRMNVILSAADDTTVQGLKDYVKSVIDGKLAVAIADDAFFQSLKVSPTASAGSSEKITDLLEYNAYLYGTIWKQLGLPYQQNQKREVVLETEMAQNNAMTRPYVDDMLAERERWIDLVNKQFGTNISVKFNGVWEEVAETPVAEEEATEEPEAKTEEEETKDDAE